MPTMVPGSGDPNSDLWFIGEAPGDEEVIAKEPFVGVAGKTLRRFLLQQGIAPNDCYLDNLYPFKAPDNKLQRLFKGGVPNPDLALSISMLEDKIREHRPNLIVPLGAIPAQILTGKLSWSKSYGTFTSIHDWRGAVLSHRSIEGQKVLPTFHPSYIGREGYQDHGIFTADLNKIKIERGFAEIRKRARTAYPDPQGSERNLIRDRLLEEGSHITVDIEYLESKLICIGMTSDSSWGTSIVIRNEGDLEYCREILLSGKPLNMQNSAFDASILEWHYGMPVFQYVDYDTMLAAHAINIELPKDLGFLSSIYTDQEPWKDMVDWDEIKQGKQPIEDVYEYNCIDAWVQHEVMEKQLEEDFAEDPRLYSVFRFEMDLLMPLWEMSKRGMKIDHDKLQEYKTQLETELAIDELVLQQLNGETPVKVSSGDQIAGLLFDTLGLKPTGYTKKKKPKTDDKSLSVILNRCKTQDQRTAVERVRSAKKKRSMLSKFVNVKLDSDGRSRGIYNPGGTKTGRLASKKFYPTGRGHQQQNIPTKSRFVFVPDTGFRFGSVDYERAESLVVAHVTNDPLMLKHHADGVNAHRELGPYLFNVEPEDVTDIQYFLCKKTRHAGNYMEGPVTMMRDINQKANETGISVTLSESTQLIESYRDIHINLRAWWLSIRETLWKKHELETLIGRPRIFYQRVDSILPKAVAYVPQGTVGDLLNIGLLNLSGIICNYAKQHLDWWEEIPEVGEELRGLDFQLLNQVHDSIGFQYPPKHETRIMDSLHRCLHIPLVSPTTFQTFYIGQEVKVGSSWGEAA
jgi:uracil-DNA glycosylase family 4